MQAVRFIGVGHTAHIADVPKPEPGPGQVLIKIGGAGVCHSDLHIMEEDLGFRGEFTLGHENAGWVAQLGVAVTGFKEGDAVAVYGPWGVDIAMPANFPWRTIVRTGLRSGGSEEDSGSTAGWRNTCWSLPPLESLSPARAAPLTDAALTPYHAIKRALPLLTPDTTVVVMGVGGLGHMALQLLRGLTPVRLIAADVDQAKLAQAKELGADEVVNTSDVKAAAEQILKIVALVAPVLYSTAWGGSRPSISPPVFWAATAFGPSWV